MNESTNIQEKEVHSDWIVKQKWEQYGCWWGNGKGPVSPTAHISWALVQIQHWLHVYDFIYYSQQHLEVVTIIFSNFKDKKTVAFMNLYDLPVIVIL